MGTGNFQSYFVKSPNLKTHFRNEVSNMKKLNVCILFGGMSPEHDVSQRSAESVLNNIDQEKYNVYPVGITKDGD